MLVADGWWSNRIRRIANGQVSTIAGTGVAGYVDGPALTARFSRPTRLLVDGSGAVYISDTDNHCIRLLR